MAAEVYCNATSDLIAEVPLIDTFDQKRRIVDFVLSSGIIYKAYDVGYVGSLFRDGIDLGAAQSSEGLASTDGKWYYASATDCLTLASTRDPSTEHLVQAGKLGTTVKEAAVEWASNLVRSIANKPILKIPSGASATGFSYDPIIVTITAKLACSRLIEPYNREMARGLREDCLAEDGESGWLDRVRDGRIALYADSSAATASGGVVVGAQNAASTGRIVQLWGSAQIDQDNVGVEIMAGGTLVAGTASPVTYKVLIKNETGLQRETYLTGASVTGGFDEIAYGVYARFAEGVYTAGDHWDLPMSGLTATAGGRTYAVEV